MIIIERDNGCVFVNEENTSHVVFDKEGRTAWIEFSHIKGGAKKFYDVKSVKYLGENKIISG